MCSICQANTATNKAPAGIEPSKPAVTEQKKTSLGRKILNVAQFIFKFVVGAALYWSTPVIFSTGLIIGIIADDKIAQIAKKINTIWQVQSTLACIAITAACYLTLPVTIAAGSFFYAAHLGSKISKEAHEIYAKRHPSAGENSQKTAAA